MTPFGEKIRELRKQRGVMLKVMAADLRARCEKARRHVISVLTFSKTAGLAVGPANSAQASTRSASTRVDRIQSLKRMPSPANLLS